MKLGFGFSRAGRSIAVHFCHGNYDILIPAEILIGLVNNLCLSIWSDCVEIMG